MTIYSIFLASADVLRYHASNAVDARSDVTGNCRAGRARRLYPRCDVPMYTKGKIFKRIKLLGMTITIMCFKVPTLQVHLSMLKLPPSIQCDWHKWNKVCACCRAKYKIWSTGFLQITILTIIKC
jgi:hypothetical protein